jgi:agmatinase
MVVMGAPFDSATSFRSGSRMGPSAIREASLMLTDGVHEHFPCEDLSQWIGDAGDMPIPTGNTIKAIDTIQSCVLRQNSHPITLGGDHSITLGVLRALYECHGKMSVVHLDAHCDTWSSHFGEPIGHGTWLRNAILEGLVDAHNVISLGVRSPADTATRTWLSQQGGRSMNSWDVMNAPPRVLADVVKNRVGANPCYLSLDIDCLDPSHAPGTGTPEIGGLSTLFVMEFFRHLLPRIQWIGMDCVEVAPSYDVSGITSLAAATFTWTYVSAMACRFKANT